MNDAFRNKRVGCGISMVNVHVRVYMCLEGDQESLRKDVYNSFLNVFTAKYFEHIQYIVDATVEK